jgi:hypothetical protein
MDSIHFILKMKNKTLVLVLFFQKKLVGAFSFPKNRFFGTGKGFQKNPHFVFLRVFFSEINKKQFQKKTKSPFFESSHFIFYAFFSF